jgi:hypothetical protein
MRTLRLALSTALVAGAAVAGAAAPAAADAAITYQGTFTQVQYGSAGTPIPASGQWSVVERNGKVTATFNIFVDGVHHLAYGVPPKAMDDGATATSFSFPIDPAVSTHPLVVTISGGSMTYEMTGYTMGGSTYDVVTYSGTVTH